MTMMTDDSIGIDISKDFLDAHRLRDGTKCCFQKPHPPAHNFLSMAKDDMPTRVVFEATGAYHRVSSERSGKIPLQ
jgi:transposase